MRHAIILAEGGIHTPDATLVYRANQAENIKEVHRLAGEKFGKNIL